MGRSRARDFEDKQKHILDTAASVFATSSIDKASMATIAQAAQVSKALLYHYYASKDDLIFGIVETQLNQLETALLAADDPALDPRSRLRKLISAVVAQFENANDLHRVRITYMSSLPDDMTVRLKDTERSIIRIFSAILAELNPALQREGGKLMPATMTMFGSFNWIYTWFRTDGTMSRDEYADLMTDLFLNGLVNIKN